MLITPLALTCSLNSEVYLLFNFSSYHSFSFSSSIHHHEHWFQPKQHNRRSTHCEHWCFPKQTPNTESPMTLLTGFPKRKRNKRCWNKHFLFDQYKATRPVSLQKHNFSLQKQKDDSVVGSSKHDVKFHFRDGKFLFQSNQGWTFTCKEKEYNKPDIPISPFECVSVFLCFFHTRDWTHIPWEQTFSLRLFRRLRISGWCTGSLWNSKICEVFFSSHNSFLFLFLPFLLLFFLGSLSLGINNSTKNPFQPKTTSECEQNDVQL